MVVSSLTARPRRLALLVAGALLALGACSDRPADAIRFGLASAPVTLDPRYATDAASTRVNRLLYRRLVDFDERFRPVPALASWERVTPTRYRFTLGARGRRFHDGSRLDARDVKATYDHVLDPENASPHRGSLAPHLERIEVVDADTVDFVLRAPDPIFPGRLALGILPRDGIAREHPFNQRPVGSGPFEFVAWPDDGALRVRRLHDGQPVEFVRVREFTVRVLKLLRGEVDLLQGDLPPEVVSWLERRGDVEVSTGRGTNFAYLGFNLEDPAVGDRRVRRAIALAVDRGAIIGHVWGGAARPASALLPPGHWAGHPSLRPIPHDPAAARRLLAEAGYGAARPLELVYKTSSDPFRVRIATIVQHQLRDAGVEVRLETHDWGTFYADVKSGRFQMYSLAWVGVKMPDIFRYVFHSEATPPRGANRGRFRSPVADRLIERAERAGDLEAQAAIYRRLQEHLLERLPYVPLWYEDNVLVTSRRVRGYRLAPDGNYDALLDVERVHDG